MKIFQLVVIRQTSFECIFFSLIVRHTIVITVYLTLMKMLESQMLMPLYYNLSGERVWKIVSCSSFSWTGVTLHLI